jgi:hypothetical protein
LRGVSNHEVSQYITFLILRDAAKGPLLRTRNITGSVEAETV